MENFWDNLGIVLTQFIGGMAKIWDWLTNTEVWIIDGMAVTPLMLFGVGLAGFLAVIIVKELIF